MPTARCPECGDTKPLVDGRCAWRHGCEHRQLVSEARERELHAMIDQTVNHWSGSETTPPGSECPRIQWIRPPAGYWPEIP